MFGVLLLLFVIIPILELYVGALVVEAVGSGPATLLLLAAVVVGVLVMRTAWRRRPRNTDSAILMVAGLLLLLPGYISDLLGLLLVIPPVRAIIRVWVGQRVSRRLATWNLTILRWDDDNGRITRANVVPGEVVDEGQSDGRVVRGEVRSNEVRLNPEDDPERGG